MAIAHYRQALQYADSLGSPWEQVRALSNLSELHYFNHQTEEAEETGQAALALTGQLGTTDIRQRVLGLLAKIRAYHHDFRQAYEYLTESFQLKDSVFNEKNQQHLNLLEAVYQTEKKELKIASLEKEKQLQMILASAGIVALILLIISLYLRQRSISNKKKLAEQEIIRLEQEKQLVATQAVLEGETAERSRLARDLHDGLGGMLSAIKLNLFDIRHGVLLSEEDVGHLNKVMTMLDSSMSELRRVAHNMMPESLARHGLKTALSDFCGSVRNVHFHYFGSEDRLNRNLEIMLYRTIQELVNNAVKHADARNIHVQIVQEPDRVSLTVQDDGKGFDPHAETPGAGLKNIRNRAESFNGTIEIFSQPGKGTEISAEFKLSNAETSHD
ncbi:MAG: ATP-binding protein [Mangrovibacterium sp.]